RCGHTHHPGCRVPPRSGRVQRRLNMSLDLSGIVSENEFYASHYLETALEEQLRTFSSEWKVGEGSLLYGLRRVAESYTSMRHELEATTDIPARVQTQRAWLRELFSTLGYRCDLSMRQLEDGSLLPILGEIATSDGLPQLWIVEAVDPSNEFSDPFLLSIVREQLPSDTEGVPRESDSAETPLIEDMITDGIFALEDPPRWILLAHAGQLILIDRTKWSQRRILR